MIHNHNQNTRFRSITDRLYCICCEEMFRKYVFKKNDADDDGVRPPSPLPGTLGVAVTRASPTLEGGDSLPLEFDTRETRQSTGGCTQ